MFCEGSGHLQSSVQWGSNAKTCFVFFPAGLKHQDSSISIHRSNHPLFCLRVQNGRALLITNCVLYNPHGYVFGTCLQLCSAQFQGKWRHLCLSGTWIVLICACVLQPVHSIHAPFLPFPVTSLHADILVHVSGRLSASSTQSRT